MRRVRHLAACRVERFIFNAAPVTASHRLQRSALLLIRQIVCIYFSLCRFDIFNSSLFDVLLAFEPQAAALKDGVDIVVGTPGRVLDFIEKGNLSLVQVISYNLVTPVCAVAVGMPAV